MIIKYKITATVTRVTDYEKIIEANSLEEAEEEANKLTVDDMDEVDCTTMGMDFVTEEL